MIEKHSYQLVAAVAREYLATCEVIGNRKKTDFESPKPKDILSESKSDEGYLEIEGMIEVKVL